MNLGVGNLRDAGLLGRTLTLASGPGAFRLGLALAVFVSHVSSLGIGRPAVVLFFMLSGYWVARLHGGWKRGYLTFEASRALRIWPLLVVTALLVWLAGLLGAMGQHGNLYSTLALLGLAMRGGDVIGVSWSLDIELQFYLLLPVCLWLLQRKAGIDIARSRWSLLFVMLLWLAGAIALYFGKLTVLAFAPAFAVGTWIYLSKWRASERLALGSVVLFALVGLLLWMVPPTQLMIIKEGHPWWLDLAYTAWCLLLVPFVAWNVHQPSPAIDREMGNLSFPFYMVHFPVIAAVTALLGSTIPTKALALALTVVGTFLLYVAVDRPIERWRSGLWRG